MNKRTKLKLYDENNALRTTDKFSIDFIPPTAQQRLKFGSLVTAELILRGLSPISNYAKRIMLLKQRLESEKKSIRVTE